MKEFEFEVEGTPKGKGRPRFARMEKAIKTYTPKTTSDYEKKIAEEFLLQGGRVFDYPYLEVSITAYFAIPKSTRKADKLLYGTGCVPYPHKPDADNLGKCVLDGLNRIAYEDDKQVVSLKVRKYYGTVAKVVIKIKEIEVDVTE